MVGGSLKTTGIKRISRGFLPVSSLAILFLIPSVMIIPLLAILQAMMVAVIPMAVDIARF